jgi:peroxiredoxin
MKLPISLLLILIFSFAVFAQQNRGNKTPAENFTAVSMSGKTFELNSLRGKVVLLTFWSTKCAICHSEIPKLNKLAERYQGKDVVFLGLTMNNEALVNSYTKKNPFNFDLLPNSFGVVLKYAEKDGAGRINMGFPAHFLIDQDGEIALKTSGFDKTEKLNAEINRLLTSKKSAED